MFREEFIHYYSWGVTMKYHMGVYTAALVFTDCIAQWLMGRQSIPILVLGEMLLVSMGAVSYTHLDVYKRQSLPTPQPGWWAGCPSAGRSSPRHFPPAPGAGRRQSCPGPLFQKRRSPPPAAPPLPPHWRGLLLDWRMCIRDRLPDPATQGRNTPWSTVGSGSVASLCSKYGQGGRTSNTVKMRTTKKPLFTGMGLSLIHI